MSLTPEVLEPRSVPSVTGLSLSVSPQILRPISPGSQPHAVTVQHVLPVTLAGEVTYRGGVPALRYQVVDQFGRYEPSGPITAMPVGAGRAFYFARIGLSDLRDPHAHGGGRRYTAIVTARDEDGSRQASAVVTVPPAGFFAVHGRRR